MVATEIVEAAPENFPGRWWRTIPGGRIECRLCPRYCKLGEGQRGFCFVRQNVGNRMQLTTYGRSSGFCIDPIEKKPLNHYLPGTAVLSFGTAGCNLGCRFCQNWDISKAREMDRLMDRAGPEEIARAAQELGCRSVAFTYNDPVVFAEYAIDIARACRERGVAAAAVSAGYITDDARADFFREMDAANIDLKAFTEEFYHRIAFGQLQPVLDTLVYLRRETQVWFEITTLLIPGANDSDAELHRAAEWVAGELGLDVPWHFTAFHPDFRMLDREATPPATLRRARRIALSKGIRYVYCGNIRDPEAQSTWCPNCGELLVERDGYRLGRFGIAAGACGRCEQVIPGRFEDCPGTWGARRRPVQLSSRHAEP
ncbi:MAG TPA: AmmeMemoRadiSam system radical SAM enzyme [Verrucomicrobiales bacterium]|nr:AmmeMemoRadiSam system radical SAM enzyme [Verrucomicrobiales bacterium]